MTLDSTSIGMGVARGLSAGMTGQVIGPSDPSYDEARGTTIGAFDRRPLAIVRVADASDVARTIRFARERDIELSVRSGGHSGAGFGVRDGGIVVDVSRMEDLRIDPDERTAWAETGLTTGEYTLAAAEHGLATPFGDTGSVGVGGLTLGGGVGYLARKFGLTVDALLAAEIVTADGELHRVDADHEADLFWAIRGGGGNFGVATRFQFRLERVPAIVGGYLILPANPDAIAGFAAAAEAAPDELTTIANVMPAPPAPFIPAEYHGKNVLLAGIAYAGPDDAGTQAIAPFRGLATPIADLVRPMRYPELYQGGEVPNIPSITHNMFMERVDASAGEVMLDRLAKATSMVRAVQFRVLGGAVSRVPNDATAYAHRDRKIMVNVAAAFPNPGEAATHRDWVAGTAQALDQGIAAAYGNFLGDEGPARTRQAYPGATWDRLAAIKARYDPTNCFRGNQNVPPA